MNSMFLIESTDALISRLSPEWRRRLGAKALPPAAFRQVADHCARRGITFLATAHDEPSLAVLDELAVPAYKIGSGEVGNWGFIEKVCRRGKPVIISTGMYAWEEVQAALAAARRAGNREIALLHCVTRYPTPPAEANLLALRTLAAGFEGVCGYSDHTAGFHIPLAAVALGAALIEKHISLDFDVPDAQDWKVSCGPHDLADFVRQAREVRAALGDGRKQPGEEELKSRAWAAKSLVAARDLPAGQALGADCLAAKRPGTGIPPHRLDEILGRVLKRPLLADDPIREEDLA